MNPTQHWLIYGDAGSGKTTAAATWPKPALVFQWDPMGKEMPYTRRGTVNESKDPEGTIIREVTSKETGGLLFRLEGYHDRDPQKPAAYRNFLSRLTRLEADLETFGFQTLIVDSVSFMELLARKYSQYALNPNSKEPRQWFGYATDALEELLMIRLGALAINVVVLAHIDDQKVSSQGTNVFSIAAPGRLSRRGPAAYSEVYHSFVRINEAGEREWLWQTQQDAMYVASTQVGAPDPCPATYSAIWLPA